MKTYYLLLCLSAVLVSVMSLSCRCDKKNCKPVICKAGYVKDVCGCCDVCAKLEGDKCGGYWNHYGECAQNHSCVVRKNGTILQNARFYIKPGHCESNACAQKSCSLHQRCTVVNGEPTCECPRHCKDKGKPVCGLRNGKEYSSVCHLRKYECKTVTKIYYKQGPCKRCVHNGMPYKFNEQIRKAECEVCTCAHGSWTCQIDLRCMKKSKQATKPVPEPFIARENGLCDLSGDSKLRCAPGFVCRPLANVPDANHRDGMCVPELITVPIPESTAAPEPECPLLKCVPCKHGYVVDIQGCQTCQCRKLKSVCKLPMYEGMCFGKIRRYYYNHKVGKCMEFDFGGCLPNRNNFKTRKACEAKCIL